ncbi:MAG: tetratricopeptide repeat protein [Phycisphaerales bacterium]
MPTPTRPRFRRVSARSILVGVAACLGAAAITGAASAQPQRAMVPEMFSLDVVVADALDAAWLSEAEQLSMEVFHGQWKGLDPELFTAGDRARIALEQWRLDDPIFDDSETPLAFRVDAHLRAGRMQAALELLEGDASVGGLGRRAEAQAALGEFDAARETLRAALNQAGAVIDRESPAELVELARARALAARLGGADAGTWRAIVSALSQVHQRYDRLHWPALVSEANVLAEKHRARLAVEAYHQALALNPNASDAWFGLGRVAISRFDFDGALRAASALERIAPDHPLGMLLAAEVRLVQDDPDAAAELLGGVLARWPGQPHAMAFAAVTEAMRYEPEAIAAALAAWDARYPRTARAHYETGRFMSLLRQYDVAASLLDEAIAREPAWTDPRVALGLMEMQAGRDDRSLAVLREASRMDPFNLQAANSFKLIEELQAYEVLDVGPFKVRYREGIDQVLVDMMTQPLLDMHADITEKFGVVPDQPTIVELMPDSARFAVRITGMPQIFTIAACTGPVIAMEVPRDGLPSQHKGPFDWIRVMRHEYAHTVTLDRTNNRIPHWLTEGAAVMMEQSPRTWSDCLMLTAALRDGELFTLDAIKWGFVRPRTPQERSQAYAQSHWMLEFMFEAYGRERVIALLDEYAGGARESEAVPAALGVTRDEFYERFLAWAEDSVAAWGLAPEPSVRDLVAMAGDRLVAEVPDEEAMGPPSTIDRVEIDPADGGAGGGAGDGAGPGPGGGPGGGGGAAGDLPPPTPPTRLEIDADLLEILLTSHPDHPDLLKMDLRRRVVSYEAAGGPDVAPPSAELAADLERYARIRPLDPFPQQILARVHLASDEPTRAIPHLQFLDEREQQSWTWARKLAELHQLAGDFEAARAAADRAVSFDPYWAANRELAATIAVQAQALEAARGHIAALAVLEPDRDIHQRRLQAIDGMLEAAGE